MGKWRKNFDLGPHLWKNVLGKKENKMQCEYHIAANLPPELDIHSYFTSTSTPRFLDSTNSTISCPENHNQCMVLWQFDDSSNDTNVLLKSCWTGYGGCNDHSQCIATENLRRLANNSRFCCCTETFCNGNFSFLPQEVTASTTETPPIVILLTSPWFLVIASVLLSMSIIIIIISIVFWNKSKFADNVKSLYADKLRLLEEIYRGRYTSVYKALKEDDQSIWAVKFYAYDRWQFFRQELEIYEILARSPHEGILKFSGFYENNDMMSASDFIKSVDEDNPLLDTRFMLITQYMKAGNLREFLKAYTFDWAVMCPLALSLVKGVAYLHKEVRHNGNIVKPTIVHRDLTSANVLLSDRNTCVICDFHCAMIADEQNFKYKDDEIAKPINVLEAGTLPYMAPEILAGTLNYRHPGSALKQADVYGLGLILWEMVSRCTFPDYDVLEYSQPYIDGSVVNAEKLANIKYLICNKDVRPVFPKAFLAYKSGPVKILKDLIEGCWHKDPEARLTASYAQEELERLYKYTVLDFSNQYDRDRHDCSDNQSEVLSISHQNTLNSTIADSYYQVSSLFRPTERSSSSNNTQTTSGFGSMCASSISNRTRGVHSTSPPFGGLSLFTAPVIRRTCDNKDYDQILANLQPSANLGDRPSSSSSNLNFDSNRYENDPQIQAGDESTILTIKNQSVSNILKDARKNSADILGYLLTKKKNDKFAKSPSVSAKSNSSSIDSAVPSDNQHLFSADARLLHVGNI